MIGVYLTRGNVLFTASASAFTADDKFISCKKKKKENVEKNIFEKMKILGTRIRQKKELCLRRLKNEDLDEITGVFFSG